MAQVTPAEMATLDPYYENVVLLLAGDEIICGRQHYKKTITAYGNTAISTAQSKFPGGSSIYFDGVGDYLYVEPTSNLTNLDADFTIELFAYCFNVSKTSNQIMDARQSMATASPWIVSIDSSKLLFFNGTNYFSTGTLSNNTWYHLALSRVGSTVKMFINGTLSGTHTISGALTGATTNPFCMGGKDIDIYKFAGYLDEIRITNGIARYTENFTPPAAEFPWLEQIKYGAHGLSNALGLLRCAPAEAMDATGLRNKAIAPTLGHRDIYYGGTGMITGTAKNTPKTPVFRRIQLIHDAAKSIIRETWSDPVTGGYVFENITRDSTYTVIGYDHTDAYRAVIADKQTAQAMP
jgi:Concanavalin A-like lectin/glucanases superfamily